MVGCRAVSVDLPFFATYMLVLVFSLTVHEWGHAVSAYWLGDDTAARMGRMTLNPGPHIDPVGTLIIPAMMVFTGGAIPLFGWAKPVPVNSARFTRSVSLRGGEALTGAAGPAMNLILALVAAVAFGVIGALKPEWLVDLNDVNRARTPLFGLLQMGISLNIALAFFNLIPVPPLDGGWLLQWLMPPKYDWVVQWLAQHGMIILLVAIFGPGYLAFLAPSGLLHYASPDTVVRVGAATALSVVSFYCFQQIRSAMKEGRRGQATSLERTVEWTMPLAVALVAAQVSFWLIGYGNAGLRVVRDGIMAALAGGA